jgi:hypothetical protein
MLHEHEHEEKSNIKVKINMDTDTGTDRTWTLSKSGIAIMQDYIFWFLLDASSLG